MWTFPDQEMNWSCSCRPTPQPWQLQILNLLNEARDQTRILMDTIVGFLTCWATTGTPMFTSLTVVMISQVCAYIKTYQVCAYIKTYQIIYFKYVQIIVC